MYSQDDLIKLNNQGKAEWPDKVLPFTLEEYEAQKNNITKFKAGDMIVLYDEKYDPAVSYVRKVVRVVMPTDVGLCQFQRNYHISISKTDDLNIMVPFYELLDMEKTEKYQESITYFYKADAIDECSVLYNSPEGIWLRL